MPTKGKNSSGEPSEKKKRYRSTFYFEGKQYEAAGKTQKDADQKAAIRLDKLRRGEAGASGDMPVKRWAEIWLETYKKPSVGEGEYRNCALYVGIVVSAIGGMKLGSVKGINLQEILNERGETGKSRHDLIKLRMKMKAMFHRAYKSKLIPYNPADELELPTAKEGMRRNITAYERKMILELAETHYAGLWVRLMLYTGLRPGEARALDWKHIDFDKKLIHVRMAMKAGTTIIGPPKSKDGVRDIPINSKLLPDLMNARGRPDSPVFTKPLNGERHDSKSMGDMWRNFKRHLDISMGATVYRNEIVNSVVAPELTSYCLRHTFCTDLQDVGVPINVARYLMGHSDIKTTAKIYTHTTEKVIQDAATKINKIDDCEMDNAMENKRKMQQTCGVDLASQA